jgi:hypothetical protein
VQRSGAANHGPKIFHAYRFAPDHKLINLEAANAQLLSCGVADSETTHGHRAYRECTNGCRASGQCARGQRPQRNPAGGDAPDSDASNFDGWQICDCTFCAMHDVLPAHNVLPLLSLSLVDLASWSWPVASGEIPNRWILCLGRPRAYVPEVGRCSGHADRLSYQTTAAFNYGE